MLQVINAINDLINALLHYSLPLFLADPPLIVYILHIFMFCGVVSVRG